MSTKPNEIRHSQVSCEVENYCLRRGQSLSYDIDLNSEAVNQLTDPDAVEVVDSDPSVSISMEVNEFGSAILTSILAGRYQGFPDETFAVDEITFNPVDLLVSVKESSSQTLANRSAWFNNFYVESITGSFGVDGFAKEAVNLTGNNLRWYITQDTSNYGATKILRFDYDSGDSTLSPDFYFDDAGQHGYLHALTDNGLLVPTTDYWFDSNNHSVLAKNGYSFQDGHRYRGLFWGRSSFPTPQDTENPIGGIRAAEVEIALWDANVDPIDWLNDVGNATNKQALRVQTIDYELGFDREALNQLYTGVFGQSISTTTITATITVLESDLEHWARGTGNWDDYTTGNLNTILLSQFQDMNSLAMRVEIFNTREYLNHNSGSLLKQIYFVDGKVTSIGTTKGVPGRGTETIELTFQSAIIRGTGAEGRSSASLWYGKDFAFVFMTDDGLEHNTGWRAELDSNGMSTTPFSIALNIAPGRSNSVLAMNQTEFSAMGANPYISTVQHAWDHGTGGPAGWVDGAFTYANTFGSIAGYIVDTSEQEVISGYSDVSFYYLRNIARDTLAVRTSSSTNLPFTPFANVTTFAYPRNFFLPENMWDLYRSGYKGARCGDSWSFSKWTRFGPTVIQNNKDAISIFRIPPITSSDICGNATAALSEATIKSNAATVFADYKSGGDYNGGICILFTHSYGNDAYHPTEVPNGWPLSDSERGIDITAYGPGVRRNELRWIMEEAENQNAKIMTFKDAIDMYWTLGHFVEEPEVEFGADYTNDIIFASGGGANYPEGEDFSDLKHDSQHVDIITKVQQNQSGYSYVDTQYYGSGQFTLGFDAVINHIEPRATHLGWAQGEAFGGVFTVEANLTSDSIHVIYPNLAFNVVPMSPGSDLTIAFNTGMLVTELLNGDVPTVRYPNGYLVAGFLSKAMKGPYDRGVFQQSDFNFTQRRIWSVVDGMIY